MGGCSLYTTVIPRNRRESPRREERFRPRTSAESVRHSLRNDAGFVSVLWDQFDSLVKNPIRRCLKQAGQDEILYIVFSFQTPYRVSSVPSGYGVSVDQYVEDIWDELGPSSRVLNPYYAEAASRAGIYRPFLSLADYRKVPATKLIYSVWRLDATSPLLAMVQVDKAIQAEREGLAGQVCIDRDSVRT